jgi:hypothetical protein
MSLTCKCSEFISQQETENKSETNYRYSSKEEYKSKENMQFRSIPKRMQVINTIENI